MFPCRTQLLLLSETMIIKASKYCYAIKDIEPKGQIHVQIVARNGVGPTVDALGPEHLPFVKDVKRMVTWLARKYGLHPRDLTIGFHPPRHTSQGAIHCHFVWKGDEKKLKEMGYDSLCVLCPGDVSSPEFVLMNNGHPNAQKLLRVGVADDAGDVA